MKNLVWWWAAVCALLLYLQADAKTAPKSGYQSATVVSVEKYETPTNYVGDNASDAPLHSDDYSYDIGIQMSCELYVGRYHSVTDYLPWALAPNHQVDVRLDKHMLYVNLPFSDREVRMGIVHHQRLSQTGCATGS